ncbi:hypothetical protein [Streptomyces niveus]
MSSLGGLGWSGAGGRMGRAAPLSLSLSSRVVRGWYGRTGRAYGAG